MFAATWTLLEVRVGPQAIEATANFLMELGSPGLEIIDQGSLTVLRAYLSGKPGDIRRQVRRYLNDLRGMGLSVDLVGIRVQPVADQDWLSAWRARCEIIKVGQRLRVQPSWIPAADDETAVTIVIDPQMAFGTGEHATTRFCLQALQEYVRQGDRVLDVGTGSGILSIAAVRLGAETALGLDTDVAALATASENARRNGVSRRVNFSNLPLNRQEAEGYPLVVANIDGQTLLPLLPELKRVTRPCGRIVLAGLLLQDEARLRQGLTRHRLIIDRREQDGEWISIIARRPGE